MFDFIKKLFKKTPKGHSNKKPCPSGVKKTAACKTECPIKKEEKKVTVASAPEISEKTIVKEALVEETPVITEPIEKEAKKEAVESQVTEDVAPAAPESPAGPEYIIKLSDDGIYTFELVGADGKVIIKSGDYTLKRSCVSGIQSVRKNGSAENGEDRTEENYAKAPNPKYEITVDEKNKYRFSLKAPNGYVILTSQAYNAKRTCMRAVNLVRKNSFTENINDTTK